MTSSAEPNAEKGSDILIYRFDKCILDLDRRSLLRDEAEQHIEPQVFDLLAFLVRSAGRTVTKEDLVEHIWDGRAISDDAITSRIKSARKAIGDDGREQRLIRTLPRVGYRFDVSVDAVPVNGDLSASEQTTQIAPEAQNQKTKQSLEAPAPEIGYLTDRKGRSIGYAVHGDGPLVVLPPFWVTASNLWHGHSDIMDFFQTLGKGLRILRYDRPGSGLNSDVAQNETLADEVELLEDMISAIASEPIRLFAISAAGAVALRYATTFPERIERICFYGAYGAGNELASPESQAMLIELIRQHWGVGSRALADIFVPSANAEERRRFAAQQRAAADAEQAVSMLKLSWSVDAKMDAPNVAVPALVLHREGDCAVPVEHGHWLARNIPGARLQVLAGDAHAPWFGPTDIAVEANKFLCNQG